MAKQRLEQTIQQFLAPLTNSYYMKLQVNPMAHTKTPGDFLWVTRTRNFIIECKECNSTSFAFNRFTQHKLLLKWNNALNRNCGLLIICFWNGRRKTSDYYVLTISDIERLMERSTKKSANRKDLAVYKVSYQELEKIFLSFDLAE